MKSILLVLISAFAFPTFAETVEFTCEFEKFKDDGVIIFQVDNIENPEARDYNYGAYSDYEGNEVPFSYHGNKMEWLYMALLVDFSYGVNTNSNGDLIVPIDDVSCDVGKIHLYKNSDFHLGYLKIEHKCSTDKPDTYSKAKCMVQVID